MTKICIKKKSLIYVIWFKIKFMALYLKNLKLEQLYEKQQYYSIEN